MADRDDIISAVQIRIKGLTQQFSDDSYYDAAVEDTEEELGWTLPITDKFKIHWFKQRTRRHLISYLLVESANKFTVDQIRLDQKFHNLHKLVKQMDDDYRLAMEECPELFVDANPARLFTMIPAGFKNDWLGRDTTYK